ncbi:ribitol kinase [Coprinopsis cinerea okayama7|uniref:Ribitol kinase n=1 Tax=Coprinopsis cinerea (strain Okayama-7 / 130 / ATCC MYA-4618 / FGSC 9003) TaxID=240176 RepID=A8P7D1_COPC7|nr:ribitol kinase [Coprinopsis cinerea okayama7\|eukprot:XP_001839335.2 ribitol kinase [Coprinopsis cinerea okayama7\
MSPTSAPSSKPLYIGIDVGTGSVRAALVQKDGELLSTSSQEIQTWRSPTDHRIFEQSTNDIWNKICGAVKRCLEEAAGVSQVSVDEIAGRVHGIGFDATCSLAVTDVDGKGVTVTQGPDLGSYGERDIILWADHRAEKEAETINATGSVVLDYVGGKISLEMEIPKILWLKNNMSPELFSRCQFFDLPDYLTYRATGSKSRSCCSLTCKCSYVSLAARAVKDGHTAPSPVDRDDSKSGWDDQFFQTIGLGELVERGYGQIGAVDENGERVLTAGMPVGSGLSKDAARELGLREGTPVGSALIDAYAGWLGTVGARCLDAEGRKEESPKLDEAKHRIAVVAGTSTCHIVMDPIFPGWWMNEGGQSSTGQASEKTDALKNGKLTVCQLIEHIITTHPAYPELKEQAKASGSNIYEVLHKKLESLRVEKGAGSYTELTKELHLYPDFHGNRSPIADSRMKGSIVGLDLDTSLSSLALLYHATLTAIALQTRSIIDTLNSKGHQIDKLYVSGSQAKNPILMKLLADACHGSSGVVKGVVITSSDSDTQSNNGGKQSGVSAVVLGAAMLGRMAHEVVAASLSGKKSDHEKVASLLWGIMAEMTPEGVFIEAMKGTSETERKLLEVKYEIFLETVKLQRKWRDAVDAVLRK